jgi:uridine kinase
MSNKKPVIIGVAGGTGSGKTTVSRVIRQRVGLERIAYLQHDSYYKDNSHLSAAKRTQINFDHPESLETSLLIKHLKKLLVGTTIETPTYDFTRHRRLPTTIRVESKPVILVEGILIFAEPELRQMFDVKIFVHTEDDIRFIRRLRRDLEQRGRSVHSVIDQWLTTVKPMHNEFVEPSKRWVDIIIPRGGKNHVAMDMVVTRIESLLEESGERARIKRHLVS